MCMITVSFDVNKFLEYICISLYYWDIFYLYIEKLCDPDQQKKKCNFINSYNDNDVSQNIIQYHESK